MERARARDLRLLRAFTQLVTLIRSNPELDEGYQIDFIEKFECSDLPPHILHFYEGDLYTLLKNIRTVSGLVKRRRYSIIDAKERVAVIQFHSGEQFAISRIPMEKCLMV
jgi:hypothetical protein